MSTMVGMGAGKKSVKDAESKLKKENKELAAANKALQKENETLHGKLAELETAAGKEPQEEPGETLTE